LRAHFFKDPFVRRSTFSPDGADGAPLIHTRAPPGPPSLVGGGP